MNDINEFKIDINGIKEAFSFKPDGGLTHTHCGKFRMLPYVANDKNLEIDYQGVAGAFSRSICGKNLSEDFNEDTFIKSVSEKIGEFEGKNAEETFKDIIKTMFLDNGNLVNFDIKTLNYIQASTKEKKIAGFLSSVLSNDALKSIADEHYDNEVKNIMYKLVLDSLPKLKDIDVKDEEFNCYLPFVRNMFLEDFRFLISNEELYKESLKRVLEFYYMFYVSQLVLKVSKFEKADLTKPDSLYYSLSWESLSKNRTAYKFGWDLLKSNVLSLFSHAVTLELLNHNNIDKQLNYIDLYDLFSKSDETMSMVEIQALIDLYKNQLTDITWSAMNIKEINSGNLAFDKVLELFETVDYQFNNSSRSRAYEAYRNWYIKFVCEKFAKKRGPLGYSLNLTEDDIILLTKICIKDKGKLKLNFLFEEFEKRGVCFDRDSKLKVIQLYEKLNLLEKKSDSGDAQYVRSVL